MTNLVCIVTLEMAHPDVPPELAARWKQQRQHKESCLSPEPHEGEVRRWRGSPECRDWFTLEALQKQKGWRTLSHARSFVERAEGQDGVKKENVELGV